MPLLRPKPRPAPKSAPIIDWSKEQALVDKDRARIAAAEQQAREAHVREQLRADPFNQLIERVYRHETEVSERLSGIEGALARIEAALAGDTPVPVAKPANRGRRPAPDEPPPPAPICGEHGVQVALCGCGEEIAA